MQVSFGFRYLQQKEGKLVIRFQSCYDVVDSYFNPKTHLVQVKKIDLDAIVFISSRKAETKNRADLCNKR
jgi:hypothetical protein